MQKWEYLFVDAAQRGTHPVWLPQYVNGEQLPEWTKGPPLHEFVNRLGEQGWELVAAPYTSNVRGDYSIHLVFKRAKP